ncbi:uncharacterized protein LOC127007052 [Eriocheir sinensis]|uniref:uncharacterized protein LOC127007052 n=1 Tax=Eriocheir sinensis TaxID=95602 RepID=UPI0021C960A4|nr:uncharacterized protein LOC127007052 [Eriocheir sinensis]XP_050733527.1 uncharacterized protein LOC127007052 [Eriocheir sinensis]
MSYVTVVEVQKSRLQAPAHGCRASNHNTVHHGDTYELSGPVTAHAPNTNSKNACQRDEKPRTYEGWPTITNTYANTTTNRPARSPSIRDQNVGVAGSVLMVSDPLCHQNYNTVLCSSSDDEVKPSSSSSLSSLSEYDSDFSTTVTVDGAKDTSLLLNADYGTKEHQSGIDQKYNCENATSGIPESPETSRVPPAADVTMEWRAPANSPPPLQPVLIPVEVDTDRGSTPASFSSAYTVTEHGSGSTSEDSEASRHNWSFPESDEEPHLAPSRNEVDNDDQVTPNSCEDSASRMNGNHSLLNKGNISFLHLRGAAQHNWLTDPVSTQMAQINEHGEDLEVVDFMSRFGHVGDDRMLRRLRRLSEGSDSSCSSSSSSERSIVYSYIPCRDQNEREDEELWVANEAADPGGVHSFQGPAPPLLPLRGWGGSLGRRGSGKRRPVLGEHLWAAHGCVAPPSCVASLMCTITPSPAFLAAGVGSSPAPGKHYTERQRASEIQNIKFVEEGPRYKQSWSELHNTDSRQTSENVMMQTSTNMPTKRFSFLIRSNSVKQETPSATEHQPVTPSDQAILDKLATLSLQAPEVVVKPQVKCSLFTPPCARCAESVYPQERVEPTLRLVYHSACFKCYHCGVRLTLKTFFRSPLDSKDSRVFCKSHVPALDPGRVSVPGSCSSHASRTLPRENTSSLHRSASTSLLRGQLDIVKCDTIGLRYL